MFIDIPMPKIAITIYTNTIKSSNPSITKKKASFLFSEYKQIF